MRRKEFEDVLTKVGFYKYKGTMNYNKGYHIHISYEIHYDIKVVIQNEYGTHYRILNLTNSPFEQILKMIEDLIGKNTEVGDNIKRMIREKRISSLLEP